MKRVFRLGGGINFPFSASFSKVKILHSGGVLKESLWRVRNGSCVQFGGALFKYYTNGMGMNCKVSNDSIVMEGHI